MGEFLPVLSTYTRSFLFTFFVLVFSVFGLGKKRVFVRSGEPFLSQGKVPDSYSSSQEKEKGQYETDCMAVMDLGAGGQLAPQ